jgi:hypothetical protein
VDRPAVAAARAAAGRRGAAGAALLAVDVAVEFLRAKDDRLLGVFTVAQAIRAAALIVLLWTPACQRGVASPTGATRRAPEKGRA